MSQDEVTKTPKIVDDKFTTILSDMERVQKKSTMYISHTGPLAFLHLGREMINNALDEHKNPNSISDGIIQIELDMTKRKMTVTDHGRGINFDDLSNACTILHAGTKMDRANGDTAGENGVGLTVTNALSDEFIIASTRDGKTRELVFHNGELKTDHTLRAPAKSHGLSVSFIPSKYFLGEDVVMPVDDLMDWLRKLSFFIDPDIQISINITNIPGKDLAFYKEYRNVTGIGGFLPELVPDANYMNKPLTLSNSMMMIEKDIPIWETNPDGSKDRKLVDIERSIKIDFSLNYNPSGDGKIYAFCNEIENIEGGQHADAVKSGIQAIIMQLYQDMKRKTDKVEVIPKDVLTGLNVVLHLSTDMSTQFTGQTKYNLGNKALYAPIRKLTMEVLNEFLRAPENQRVLYTILDMVKTNAKIRTDETKKRSSIKRESPTVVGSKVIVGYCPANHINKSIGRNRENEKLELFVVEGDSAGGNARKARYNNDIQGILAMKGKPPNNYNIETKMLSKRDGKHDEFYTILFDTILGCGYGNHFNEDALIYDKLILDADADVDGGHIDGLHLANIAKHCPQLITTGHVYRVVPPLYRLRTAHGKNVIQSEDYLYSKTEIYDRFAENVINEFKIRPVGSNQFFTDEQLAQFIKYNREYYRILSILVDNNKVSSDVIEYIVFHLDTFMNKGVLSKLDPELYYDKDGECVTGCYKTQYVSMIIDDAIMSNLRILHRIFINENGGEGMYTLYERHGSRMTNSGDFTIGQIMERAMKFYPKLSGRYKGLGEMTPAEMRELMMNPNTRRLYRFTMNDVEGSLRTFDELFLDKHRGTRKRLVADAEISIDDIDN